jgi:hypothetical protein
MKLKKINEGLKESLIANGLTELMECKRNFSTLKSGADCIILHLQIVENNNNCYQCYSAISERGEQSPER